MSEAIASFVALTINGVSFGMILFLISSGLTITLGVMRVVNLAHLGFAMIGGYIALALMQNLDIGLFSALPLAVIGVVILALVLERTVYQWVYQVSELGQVLMTIGLTFVMIASVNAIFGPLIYTLPLPEWLRGNIGVGIFQSSSYRAFLVLVSGLIALALWYALERTLFGARLRAAVDNPRMAQCAGINVRRIFAVTFATGCALAAIGGALGAQMLPLEPFYALHHLILVLIVVAVGGLGSLKGSLVAALLVGLLDTYGRYYLPELGGFVMYILIAATLTVRPQGLYARV